VRDHSKDHPMTAFTFSATRYRDLDIHHSAGLH
jgi:hypothetical protein